MSRALPAFPALGALLFFHWPLLLGRECYYRWDLYHRFFPMREVYREAFVQGRLPLWNPLILCGVSAIGNPEAGLLYPGTLIFAFLPFVQALGVFLFLHQAWGALGLYRLSKEAGAGSWESAFAALAWSASGALLIRVHFLSLFATLAWMPWATLFAYQLAMKPRMRLTLAFSGSLTMAFLGGHPREFLFCLVACVAALGLAIHQRGFSTQGVVSPALGLGLAGLLAAGQGLPFLDLIRRTGRGAGLTLKEATRGGWDRLHFLHWLWPDLVHQEQFLGVKAPNQPWSGFGYCGILTLLLALAGWNGLRGRLKWICAVVLFSLVEIGTGESSLIWRGLWVLIPGLDRLRYSQNAVVLAALAFCLLAALGLGKLRSRVRAGAFPFLILLLCVFQVWDSARLRSWICPLASSQAFSTTLPGDEELRRQVGAGRLYSLPGMTSHRVWARDEAGEGLMDARNRMIPNLNMLAGVRLAGGVEALVPGRYQEFMSLVGPDEKEALAGALPWFQPLFPLYAAGWAMFGQVEGEPGFARSPLVGPLPRGPLADLPEVVEVKGREEAAESLGERGPRPMPVETGGSAALSTPGAGGQIVGYEEDGLGSCRVRLAGSGPGWLFLSWSWDPGLKAFSDASSLELVPAGLAFCAVRLRGGEKTVELRYQPAAFLSGFFLSLVGLTIVCCLLTCQGSASRA